MNFMAWLPGGPARFNCRPPRGPPELRRMRGAAPRPPPARPPAPWPAPRLTGVLPVARPSLYNPGLQHGQVHLLGCEGRPFETDPHCIVDGIRNGRDGGHHRMLADPP